MGRLFWKFFLFFWLAQLVTSIGVGIAIWTLRPPHPDEQNRPPPLLALEQRHPDADRPPPRPHWLPPVMPVLAGSVVSLLFAALLAWYFARPIRTLRQALAAVAGGQLDARAGPSMGTRRDELADLGHDFDRMAERLQLLIEGQRRLLHDVSHELRSPLARLQAIADLIRQQPERCIELIERLERDTSRMDKLVGELLTLARLDAGVSLSSEVFDLAELVSEVVDDAAVEADAHPCRIVLGRTPALSVRATPDLLRRAIENVLRNAIRHSPPNGMIEVSLAIVNNAVSLTITDQGSGVDDDELGQIFLPFQRARNAGTFSGYGLGLAITRRVMQLHSGGAEARNRPTGGLAVSLSIPLAS